MGTIKAWRFYAVACSDPDTCEGRVSRRLYDYQKSDGHCWHSWAHGIGSLPVVPWVPPRSGGNPLIDTAWNSGIPLKSPLYIRFTTIPIGSGGDLDEIEKDFTIGISITGTNVD